MQKKTFASRSSSVRPLNLILLDQRGINAEASFKPIEVQTGVPVTKVSWRHWCGLDLTSLHPDSPLPSWAWAGGNTALPAVHTQAFPLALVTSGHCPLTRWSVSCVPAALFTCALVSRPPQEAVPPRSLQSPFAAVSPALSPACT